ncbi:MULTISPECIES: hypothetical protein [unclassified Aliivibrio]
MFKTKKEAKLSILDYLPYYNGCGPIPLMGICHRSNTRKKHDI